MPPQIRTPNNLPIVHVSAFCKNLEAEKDCEESLISQINEIFKGYFTMERNMCNFHLIRGVSGQTKMYCVEFRIPTEVAYANIEDGRLGE